MVMVLHGIQLIIPFYFQVKLIKGSVFGILKKINNKILNIPLLLKFFTIMLPFRT